MELSRRTQGTLTTLTVSDPRRTTLDSLEELMAVGWLCSQSVL